MKFVQPFLPFLLNNALFPSAIYGHTSHGPGDCGNPIPSQADKARAVANEISVFGKPGNQLTRQELSHLVQSTAAKSKGPHPPPFEGGEGRGLRSLQGTDPAYTLVDIPLVYHVLVGQSKPGSNAGPVRATADQLEFMTNKTNELYKIYDKMSKTSVQWASFVNNQTIYHPDVINADCDSLTNSNYASIIKAVDEWQFKLHVIICESTLWSGVASFPSSYPVDNVLHNMVRVEFCAVACYNDNRNFLCDLTDGQQISHTRWWRTRLTVTSHELGYVCWFSRSFLLSHH